MDEPKHISEVLTEYWQKLNDELIEEQQKELTIFEQLERI